MRLVFFGDGPWAAASLQRLLKDGHSVLLTVLRSRPSDQSLEVVARSAGIEIVQPTDSAASDFVARVGRYAPDLGISVSYDQILRPELIKLPRLGFINFHAGMLPRYRGRNVINWAIINNEKEIGVTAHFIDVGIDTGDIILQRKLPILWEDDYASVLGRVTQAMPNIVSDAIRIFDTGTVMRTRQDDTVATYFSGRREGDEWIDWRDTSLDIYNKIRAIAAPGPGARTLCDTKLLLIWKVRYDPAWPKYMATPGEVIGKSPVEGAIVKTGDSTLLISTAQFPGSQLFTPKWRTGTRLGISYLDIVSAITSMKGQAGGGESGVQ